MKDTSGVALCQCIGMAGKVIGVEGEINLESFGSKFDSGGFCLLPD